MIEGCKIVDPKCDKKIWIMNDLEKCMFFMEIHGINMEDKPV